MNDNAAFDLMRSKLDDAISAHRAQLNSELYRVSTTVQMRPLTRRERFALRSARVRGYFVTLWAALRGKATEHDDYDW